MSNVAKPTNPNRKFGARMDHVQHMFALAAVSASAGETFADGIAGPGHEVSDGVGYIKAPGTQDFFNRDAGFSSLDLEWNLRGSELQNAFDTDECDCRKLAKKFSSGTFTVSNWKAWYRQPWFVIYMKKLFIVIWRSFLICLIGVLLGFLGDKIFGLPSGHYFLGSIFGLFSIFTVLSFCIKNFYFLDFNCRLWLLSITIGAALAFFILPFYHEYFPTYNLEDEGFIM
jgi:hypothetical protein